MIIYVDGVETTAYGFVDSEITFDTAPADGAVITADYEYSPVTHIVTNTAHSASLVAARAESPYHNT